MLSKCSESDLTNILNILSNVFIKHEPMCKELEISSFDFIYTFATVISACIYYGYSYMIKDDNDICSILLALPYDIYEKINIDSTNNIYPLINCLNELNKYSNFDKNKTMYLFILGTNEKYMNRGYGKLLLNNLINILPDTYDTILADATNIISQNILYKNNFTSVYDLKYSTFPEFTNIKDTIYVKRMIKTLM